MPAVVLLVLYLTLTPGGIQEAGTFDRTVEVVAGQVIMASDLPLVRALKLVASTDDSDAAVLTALENRLLVLGEVARSAQPPPPSGDVDARRGQWEAALGAGGPAVAQRLADAHMTEAALMAWLRDDVRIQRYEDQRFGRQQDPAAAVARWIVDLRKRAGLK